MPVARGDSAAAATYQIQLRHAGDFVVVHPPPWWTVRRIAIALGIAGVAAAVALAWVISLRRRVREQTEIIRHQLERETVAEERSRIARDLHDTLAQHLAGITIQLDAASERLRAAPGDGLELLETAREMATHSMEQTRLAIWDLRSPTLAREGLFSALQETLQPLAEQRGVALHVEVTGQPRRLGGRTENHILRIAHEAGTNALKHADAVQIRVSFCFGEEDLKVVVADNGRGFTVPPFEALPAGHFGLRGLLERVKKINGRLLLESWGGAGTTVTVMIPYPEPASIGRSDLGSGWRVQAA